MIIQSVVYVKSGRRRPVRLTSAAYPADVQQHIPLAWCVSCGQEIFEEETEFCYWCERMKHDGKSMSELQPGERPEEL